MTDRHDRQMFADLVVELQSRGVMFEVKRFGNLAEVRIYGAA